MCRSVSQCVVFSHAHASALAVCCGVLQCVVLCGRVAVTCSVPNMLQCIAMCYSACRHSTLTLPLRNILLRLCQSAPPRSPHVPGRFRGSPAQFCGSPPPSFLPRRRHVLQVTVNPPPLVQAWRHDTPAIFLIPTACGGVVAVPRGRRLLRMLEPTFHAAPFIAAAAAAANTAERALLRRVFRHHQVGCVWHLCVCKRGGVG